MQNYFLHNIIYDVLSFSALEVSSVYFNMDGSYIFFHEIYVFGITNLPSKINLCYFQFVCANLLYLQLILVFHFLSVDFSGSNQISIQPHHPTNVFSKSSLFEAIFLSFH